MPTSQITYWKLTQALPFEGKVGLLDALSIVCLNNLTTFNVTVVYEEGWGIKDASGNVTDFKAVGGRKDWNWSGATFITEKGKKIADLTAVNPNATRETDLMPLFYTHLGASRPEYAGSLIVRDV